MHSTLWGQAIHQGRIYEIATNGTASEHLLFVTGYSARVLCRRRGHGHRPK